eukprot:scaffold748_cov251-Pinguiococcus_pyrenoidosus.AAC.64
MLLRKFKAAISRTAQRVWAAPRRTGYRRPRRFTPRAFRVTGWPSLMRGLGKGGIWGANAGFLDRTRDGQRRI